MIRYDDAVRTARSLMSTPYSEMDCIRLIVMIIRRTAGGDPDYRCEGTNWLWRSIKNSSKYRHLTWQQESIEGAKAGMLAFKRDGDDVHHVGFVTAEGTVIHSSSVRGMVVETPLDNSWHLLAVHRDLMLAVDVDDGEERGEQSFPSADTGEAQQEQSPTPTGDGNRGFTSLVKEDGTVIMLAGRWRVADD